MPATSEVTPKGSRFLSYLEKVNGDPVRAFVPVKPAKRSTAVWLLHAYGSSHDALLGGYAGTGAALVDAGCVVVCPNLGGSLWSSAKAQKHLTDAHAALETQLRKIGVSIARNVLVGTSHGACLATYATGKNLLPNIRGLYVVNGVYDTEALSSSLMGFGMRLSVSSANGGNTSQVRATNPARIPATAFTVPVRLVYSQPDSFDTTVPPARHAKVFARNLKAAGRPFTVRKHKSGHHTPGGTPADVAAFVASPVGPFSLT